VTRFRAHQAPSEQDREIVLHLDRASQEIERALQVAKTASRKEGYLGVRARRVERDLGRLLRRLHEIGFITPRGYQEEEPREEKPRNDKKKEEGVKRD
jgi:hypothetical protein